MCSSRCLFLGCLFALHMNSNTFEHIFVYVWYSLNVINFIFWPLMEVKLLLNQTMARISLWAINQKWICVTHGGEIGSGPPLQVRVDCFIRATVVGTCLRLWQLESFSLQVRMYSRALAIIGGFLILASGAGEVYRQKPRSRSLQSTGQVFLGVYLICMVRHISLL